MHKKFFYFLKRYGIFLTLKAIYYYIKIRVKNYFALLKIYSEHPLKDTVPEKHIYNKNFKILFLTFAYQSESKRYRIDNIIEYLKIAGIQSEVIYQERLKIILSYALSFDIIVLFRLPINNELEQLIIEAKRLNIPIIYSNDDLIFNAEILEKYIRLPKEFEKNEKIFYINEAKKHIATFNMCDYFLGTTGFLAHEAEKLGKKSFVIRNGLNQEQIKVSARINTSTPSLRGVKRRSNHDILGLTARLPRSPSGSLAMTILKALQRFGLRNDTADKNITIGYFSGTKTHDYDFKSVEPALIKIFKEYPNARLYITGFLGLSDNLKKFNGQIKNVSFVEWQKLLYEIAKADINIAPLEMNNPIVESKSELKYFEAGLVKIPTIASATDAFKYAIKNGENGFLAYNDDDWYKHLKMLIENPELRHKIGENAYKHAMNNYAPEPLSRQTKKVFEEIYNSYWNNKKIK